MAGSGNLKIRKTSEWFNWNFREPLSTIGKFDKIKVCVAYDHNGEVTEDFSTNLKFLEECKPVYKEFDGNFWRSVRM